MHHVDHLTKLIPDIKLICGWVKCLEQSTSFLNFFFCSSLPGFLHSGNHSRINIRDGYHNKIFENRITSQKVRSISKKQQHIFRDFQIFCKWIFLQKKCRKSENLGKSENHEKDRHFFKTTQLFCCCWVFRYFCVFFLNQNQGQAWKLQKHRDNLCWKW